MTKPDEGTFDGLCRALIVDGQKHVAKKLRDEEERVLDQDDGSEVEASSSATNTPYVNQITTNNPSNASIEGK